TPSTTTSFDNAARYLVRIKLSRKDIAAIFFAKRTALIAHGARRRRLSPLLERRKFCAGQAGIARLSTTAFVGASVDPVHQAVAAGILDDGRYAKQVSAGIETEVINARSAVGKIV